MAYVECAFSARNHKGEAATTQNKQRRKNNELHELHTVDFTYLTNSQVMLALVHRHALDFSAFRSHSGEDARKSWRNHSVEMCCIMVFVIKRVDILICRFLKK